MPGGFFVVSGSTWKSTGFVHAVCMRGEDCGDTWRSRSSAFLNGNRLYPLPSKPDESRSEKSKTETRKTAFCSSETPKSHADDRPVAAGCPVSNPDNNCANGLFQVT